MSVKESLKTAENCICIAIRALKASVYGVTDEKRLERVQELIEKDREALNLIRHLINKTEGE